MHIFACLTEYRIVVTSEYASNSHSMSPWSMTHVVVNMHSNCNSRTSGRWW